MFNFRASVKVWEMLGYNRKWWLNMFGPLCAGRLLAARGVLPQLAPEMLVARFTGDRRRSALIHGAIYLLILAFVAVGGFADGEHSAKIGTHNFVVFARE